MKRAPLAVLWLIACTLLAASCSSVDVVGSGTGAAGGLDAGTTSQHGGGGGDAGSPPASTRFVLRFISDVPESIWADETDSAGLGTGHWLTILRDGSAIRKAPACEYCPCDDCPNCPVCGAPCPTATEIASGHELEWQWSGLEYTTSQCPVSPQDTCMAGVASPLGSYVARFCWGTSYTGTPPCPAEVIDVQCAEVPFQHPDPDGEVEYLVNNSG